MKFVALISGGKDSFYNIHHAISRGHELACLANLYPSEPDRDEIDSFMFQTVGHDIIDNYSECLSVLLYREQISGSSKNQQLEYSITNEDEIEDLYRLLSKVIQAHPDVEGVSCGAILSHYQRTRVENVCGRLGLTSLTYLWQRNQLQLMGEMCASGLDARIIKVAAVGLSEVDLGKSISQLYPKLIKLNQMYDVHICGEGGEFETLVFDAPFFKKKLEVTSSEIVADSTDDVSYLKVKVTVVDKDAAGESFVNLDRPALLDEEFEEILEAVKDELQDTDKLAASSTEFDRTASTHASVTPRVSLVETPNKVYVSNLVSEDIGTRSTIESQAESIFSQLQKILVDRGLTPNNIKHVTLLLSDMNEFSRINSVYSAFFADYYLPPSRICVGTALIGDCLAQLSCEILVSPSLSKEGIHIRSRSYWAPHNIGPYSQSIVERNEDYLSASLSGQIPLDPSTMDFPTNDDIAFHSVLSVQHLHKVTEVVNVTDNYGSICCFITDASSHMVASATWNQYTSNKASLVIVQVKQLPRGAKIEWGGFSYRNIVGMYDDDDDDEGEETGIGNAVSKLLQGLHFTDLYTEKIGKGSLYTSTIFSNDSNTVEQFLASAQGKIQLYTNITNSGGLDLGKVEYTPVQAVWNHRGVPYKYALVWKYYK